MANGRSAGRRKGDPGRDGDRYVALPHVVLDSAAYMGLNHPAKALLIELARQFAGDNNGRLLASGAYLAKRGWKSSDVIVRAKRELLEADLIFETVKGARPNRASWYAVTWRVLDRHPSFDPGAAAGFERGAYRRHDQVQNAVPTPRAGVGKAAIAPSHGLGHPSPTPSHGAIRPVLTPSPTPSRGDHLEKPSAVRSKRAATTKGTP